MSYAKLMGHTITHDWTTNETPSRTPEILGNFAKLDIDGVVNADCLIAIMDDPEYMYRGTFTEIGAAIAIGKKIYVYCPNDNAKCLTNCFIYHPAIIRVDNVTVFLSELK